MNFFRNATISARLSLGFAIVILAGLAVAWFGRSELQGVDRQLDKLAKDGMAKVLDLSDVANNMNVVARLGRDMLLVTDESEMKQMHKRLLDTQKENAAILKRLDESYVAANEGRVLMTKIMDARKANRAAIEKAVQLVLDNQRDEARQVFLKESRTLQEAYFESLDHLMDWQREQAQKTADEAHLSATVAGRTMLIIALLSAAAGVAITLLITSNIKRQLGGEPAYATGIAREIAAGNLAVEVHVRQGDDTSILAALRQMRDGLVNIVSQVRQSSDSIATGTTQIATGNADLAQRTEEQASNLQQTAASMEQMSATLKQNTETARAATELATAASTVATKGGEVVGQVVRTMEDITASSKRIADIIGVIDGIAFQTNILALNAAVEAARAGEQGRGFAVVAGEVRSLAQRSATAAKEIKSLIGESVEKVDAGSRLVDEAGTTMSDIVAQVRRVAGMIGDIGAATQEQTKGIVQVSEAVGVLDQVTQQNSALVEEAAASAESLQQQAHRLSEMVGVFRIEEGARSQALAAA